MAYQIPVLDDFRTQFPELSAYTDAQVNQWLAQSTPFFNLQRWDDMLFLGMLYWTAHMLVLSKLITTQPQIDDSISKKVGDIMKTRSDKLVQMQADNPYYRTTYGQQYLLYQGLIGVGGAAV